MCVRYVSKQTPFSHPTRPTITHITRPYEFDDVEKKEDQFCPTGKLVHAHTSFASMHMPSASLLSFSMRLTRLSYHPFPHQTPNHSSFVLSKTNQLPTAPLLSSSRCKYSRILQSQ